MRLVANLAQKTTFLATRKVLLFRPEMSKLLKIEKAARGLDSRLPSKEEWSRDTLHLSLKSFYICQ